MPHRAPGPHARKTTADFWPIPSDWSTDMQPRTRLRRRPVSRLRLAAYGGLVTAGLTASLIGVMPSASAAEGDTGDNPFRLFVSRLLPGYQEQAPPSELFVQPESAPNTANAPNPAAAPAEAVAPDADTAVAEESVDGPEPAARQRLQMRPGMDIGDGEVFDPLPPGGDPDPDDDPGSYSGGWAGDTVVTEGKFRFAESQLKSFNTKDLLRDAWNLYDTTIESVLEERITAESDEKLYNVNVSLAAADDDSLLSLTVSPRHKTISLFYLVDSHQMQAKVDADSFLVNDPTATMSFAIGLRLDFTTDAGSATPLTLNSAEAVIMPDSNGVQVNGDVTYTVGKALRFLKNLGNVDSVEQAITDEFTGASSDVASTVEPPLETLNDVLNGVIDRVDAPVGAIVPSYDSDTYRLVLRLDTRPTVMQYPEASLGR